MNHITLNHLEGVLHGQNENANSDEQRPVDTIRRTVQSAEHLREHAMVLPQNRIAVLQNRRARLFRSR